MEPEIAMLRSLLKNEETKDTAGFEFYQGILDGRETVLLRCGIGKVNAAVGCALLIDKYSPGTVINTGSAGGIGRDLGFGDVVISSGLVQHDVDVRVFNYEAGQIPGMPPVFPVPEHLIVLAEQAIEELKREGILPKDFNHLRGIIGSSDAFMHEPDRIAAAAALFPEMRAVDMESAAVAHACWLFKVPCLVIRALSDIAGTESPVTHDEFLPLASRNSCEIVKRIIAKL